LLFTDLNLIKPILDALADTGYEKPTPIQQQAIPIILDQRDLLGCAQTGTGKTAAFAIPIIQLLHGQPKLEKGLRRVKVLILTPTRELAVQIEENFSTYAKYSNLSQTVIFGGVSQHSQTEKLKRGTDILVATPGRLLDLMQQGYIDLRHLQILVLDEADRMLDMGFVNDVKKIISKVPAKRQTLFFSATMPKEIQGLANTILDNPLRVEITPESTTAETIKQLLFYVDKPEKRFLLNHLLKDKGIKSALVFTRTKHGADRVVKDLEKAGTSAEAIHGNKSQNARQRALNNFKDGETRVLVATDIAARGIDVDNLSHVINYELPNVPETYVHRIGRTGRAGASGIAYSFCDEEERAFLKDIQRTIGMQIPVSNDNPYAMSAETINKVVSPYPSPNGGNSQPRHKKKSPSNGSGQAPKAGGGGNPNWKKNKSNGGGGGKPKSFSKPA
jgi:ATP-dependent RNA helicase RhlE